jgi:signal transduction histidine kinase
VDRLKALERWVADEVFDLGIPKDAVRPEDMRRIRILSITTLFLALSAGLPAIGQFVVLGLHQLAVACVFTVVAAIGNLFLLRTLRRPNLCAHLALANLGLFLVLSNTTTGGFYDPNFGWLYVLPLGAAALIDLRGAMVWTVATIAVTVAFWMLPSIGIELVNQVPESARAGNALFNRVTTLVAIGVIASGFVAGQRRAERQLATANHDLVIETAYVQLLMHTAVAGNEAHSFESALQDGMRRICETMGWLGGHIYLVNEDGSITTSGVLYKRDSTLDALDDYARTASYQTGLGVVGLAVAEREPKIVDVPDPAYTGDDPGVIALRVGIRCAVTVPVFVDGSVPAVMLFACPETLENRERLREVFKLIGVQLGKVAERGALQQRAHQSQRLEAVGQLAAGVAHEINNPMSYVRSNLHSLREEWSGLRGKLALGDDAAAARFDECQELIEESLEGVERTIAIVRDVKEFSHGGNVDRAAWETVRLSDLLEGARRVVSGQAPSGVRLESHHAGETTCRCAPNQIRQVFVNLIVNAIQAVGERGTISLSTGRDGDRVFARVADDGPGIDARTRDRLFDPFFTTKPVGEGTGLGLSVSWEIVRNHGGEIVVVSEPGAGASFEVRLPVEPA